MATLTRRVEAAEERATRAAKALAALAEYERDAIRIAKRLAETLAERGAVAVQIVVDATDSGVRTGWRWPRDIPMPRQAVTDKVGIVDLREDGRDELVALGRIVDGFIAAADSVLEAPRDGERVGEFVSACHSLDLCVRSIVTDEVMSSRRPLCGNVNGCPDSAFVENVKAQRCKACRRQQLLHDGRDRPGPNGEGKPTKRLAAAR